MKKIFVCGLLMALTLSACQNKGIEVLTQSRSKAFTAVVEESFTDGTKTSMDGDGNVLWKKGDQVSIFEGSTINEHYQVSDASDGKTSASLNKVTGGGFVAGTDIDNNVAFYPYASTAELAKSGSNYVISDIELPATQTYAAGSFGNGAFPMAAVTSSTEDMNLKFKNVLGGLKLQLKGTATITSITVTGNNNEILCGDAEVTMAYGGVPSISLSDASAKTVTLDCGAGVSLDSEMATPFIIALPPMTMTGGFTVIVTDSESKQMEIKTTKSQTIPRSNLLRMPAVTYEGTSPVAVPEAIDLGLPSGLKWASFNVGASSPEEYGDYFAWGETAPKSNYDWSTYKYCNGSYNTLTKYCNDSSYGYNGFTDNKTILELTDDVANVKLGGSWRMPTDAEWTELRNNCTWTWTTQNGVNGYIVTSKTNSNSIFLPVAGYRRDAYLYGVGSGGYYWSSSLDTGYPYLAWYVEFGSSGVYSCGGLVRYYGRSVRPVFGECVPVESISLSDTSLSLTEGNLYQLTATIEPAYAWNRGVTWTTSNESIVTVTTEGMVTALKGGSATITATTHDGGYAASCTVTVKEIVAPGIVDLGLSVKWGSFNLGADTPEGYGNYYAWGETALKSNYDWSTYKYCNGSSNTLTKYCNDSYYGYNGFADNKTVLDMSDDVVNVKLGGSWRMATYAEWTELRNNCTWTWTTQNGRNGYLVTSKTNSNSIFLPAAGYRYGTYLNCVGFCGYYWSSSLSTDNPGYAWYVLFDSSGIDWDSYYRRFSGQSVRPVYDPAIHVTAISLNHSDLTFTKLSTVQTLTAEITPSDATNKNVTWSSSNTEVVTVSQDGKVTSVGYGTATITATTEDGGLTATCNVRVITLPEGPVDLGLSVKWASFNVGASFPEEYGGYFAWGETETKTKYSWSTYKYCNGSSNTLTKYCNKSSYGYNGFTDTKTVLDLEDDAARVNWGGSWRMPTDAEWTELINNCTCTWTTQNGRNGYLVTSKTNSNSIFLPAAGYRGDAILYYVRSNGDYWSSSLGTGGPNGAWDVSFSSSYVGRSYRSRYYGQSVRPVTE